MGQLFGRRRLITGALVFAGLGCGDATAPSHSVAAVGITPSFSAGAIDSFEQARVTGVAIDNARLRLTRATGNVAHDVSLPIAAGQDSLVIDLTVRIISEQELLTVRLELRQGDLVLFSGVGVVLAVAGAVAQAPVIPMVYVGPVVAPLVSQLVLSSSILSGTAGSLLTQPLTVRALTNEGAPVPGVPVSWSVLSGGATVGQAVTITNANGVASTSVTLGSAAGEQVVQATADGVEPIPITLTALAGAAYAVRLVTRPSALAITGSPFEQQPVARIADMYGNTVTSSTAPIVASAVGGTVFGTTTALAVNGVASFADLGILSQLGTALMSFTSPGLIGDTASVDVLPVDLPAARRPPTRGDEVGARQDQGHRRLSGHDLPFRE